MQQAHEVNLEIRGNASSFRCCRVSEPQGDHVCDSGEDEELLINPNNKNKRDKMRVTKIFENFIGTKED